MQQIVDILKKTQRRAQHIVFVKIGKCGFPQIKFPFTGTMFTSRKFRAIQISRKIRRKRAFTYRDALRVSSTKKSGSNVLLIVKKTPFIQLPRKTRNHRPQRHSRAVPNASRHSIRNTSSILPQSILHNQPSTQSSNSSHSAPMQTSPVVNLPTRGIKPP